MENFTPAQIAEILRLKDQHSFNCIFENFKYESDLNTFVSSLKHELHKFSPLSPENKTLHKKSSDSQLLENKEKNANRLAKRKFSNENLNLNFNLIDIDPRSPSPKDSEYSLCNKNSSAPDLIEVVKNQWRNEFE